MEGEINHSDDLTSARLNQHGAVVDNRIAVRIAQTDACRKRIEPCRTGHWLTNRYLFRHPPRGPLLGRHIRAHPFRLLGGENPTCGGSSDPTDSRPDWTTHHSADDSTARRPSHKPCSRVCLARRQGKSEDAKSQGRLEIRTMHWLSVRCA
jgi:hypothetical protein